MDKKESYQNKNRGKIMPVVNTELGRKAKVAKDRAEMAARLAAAPQNNPLYKALASHPMVTGSLQQGETAGSFAAWALKQMSDEQKEMLMNNPFSKHVNLDAIVKPLAMEWQRRRSSTMGGGANVRETPDKQKNYVDILPKVSKRAALVRNIKLGIN
jgi:hypothetical protein